MKMYRVQYSIVMQPREALNKGEPNFYMEAAPPSDERLILGATMLLTSISFNSGMDK